MKQEKEALRLLCAGSWPTVLTEKDDTKVKLDVAMNAYFIPDCLFHVNL